MSIIRAFKGIRPRKDLADKIASLPYDVINTSEAREIGNKNPYSFLHIGRAEIDLPLDIDPYDDRVYNRALENLKGMLEKNELIKDSKPCLYIYSLTMDNRTQTGLVCCTSIDEYLNGTIKKHEHTRAEKEKDRIRHVDICNANTGPIFLCMKENMEIKNIISDYTKNTPEYDFVADDGIGHRVWVIDNDEVIESLINSFKNVKNLYIADGHHRNASAVKVGLKRREEKGSYTGDEEFNYYLSVIFFGDELKILDYNRVVRDLNGYDKEGFLERLKEDFELSEVSDRYKPNKTHSFGMYLEGKWYSLLAKPSIIVEDVVGCLDVSILQENVLNKILNIEDPKTDKRIDFVGGIRGLGELERLVNSNEFKVAFSMYPTSVNELMDIADAGEIMPPKSTWFEPKLRSGLFIHSLD